ncbi:type IV pilus twitching motility protein PilT [Limnohabitans sp. Rim8]|uniref:type IV pilus twitching motility protein PilT n=1 Tax=Limnohabitans sp. Rim8 TaxID=1100718 RepID=UPI0033057E16
MQIEQWLRMALALGASDLHLSAGLAPMVRVHGELRTLDTQAPVCTDTQIRQVLAHIMPPARWAVFTDTLEDDFAIEWADGGRFRVNAFHHQRGPGLVMRAIAQQVPRLGDLHAPELLSSLALKSSGLILVTGPTGCGKSTLLAALLDHANRSLRGHLLTIEDPIEFVHTPLQCAVNQREVGLHTHSFEAALRSALREDPDVILIGELRDLASIRLALTAAETGHLVLASLHTASAPRAVDRIVDVFPAEEKDMVRTMLSESLLAVVAQTLCKREDGQGRIAAHEVMLATPAIRNLIREGKVAQLYSALQTGGQAGMQTLDQSLQALAKKSLISMATARALARFPENFPA